MLKKYISKFAMDILPSVVATIIGAYIVNHYIVTKPGTDAPVASAVSTADPKAAPEAAKIDAKTDAKTDAKADTKASAKAPETSTDVVNVREPGVKARGISEKAILEKSAAETPQEKPAESAADKPAETAAIPVEPRRHPSAPREKAVARTVPAPAPAVATVVSPVPVVPADTASAPEERRDANDLARAAIERLRGTNEASPRAQEAARTPDAARVQDAPRVVSAPAVRPLPPPIMVSTPANEPLNSQAGPSAARAPYAAGARIDDPNRPTPPADIPSRPLDLRAEAAEPPVRERTTVAEDVLSAAKSVFHAVLPK